MGTSQVPLVWKSAHKYGQGTVSLQIRRIGLTRIDSDWLGLTRIDSDFDYFLTTYWQPIGWPLVQNKINQRHPVLDMV